MRARPPGTLFNFCSIKLISVDFIGVLLHQFDIMLCDEGDGVMDFAKMSRGTFCVARWRGGLWRGRRFVGRIARYGAFRAFRGVGTILVGGDVLRHFWAASRQVLTPLVGPFVGGGAMASDKR